MHSPYQMKIAMLIDMITISPFIISLTYVNFIMGQINAHFILLVVNYMGIAY